MELSAADLKFLHRLRQTDFRNFKSKSGTRIICLLVPLLLPKFVSEVPQCITNFGSGALASGTFRSTAGLNFAAPVLFNGDVRAPRTSSPSFKSKPMRPITFALIIAALSFSVARASAQAVDPASCTAGNATSDQRIAACSAARSQPRYRAGDFERLCRARLGARGQRPPRSGHERRQRGSPGRSEQRDGVPRPRRA